MWWTIVKPLAYNDGLVHCDYLVPCRWLDSPYAHTNGKVFMLPRLDPLDEHDVQCRFVCTAFFMFSHALSANHMVVSCYRLRFVVMTMMTLTVLSSA